MPDPASENEDRTVGKSLGDGGEDVGPPGACERGKPDWSYPSSGRGVGESLWELCVCSSIESVVLANPNRVVASVGTDACGLIRGGCGVCRDELKERPVSSVLDPAEG